MGTDYALEKMKYDPENLPRLVAEHESLLRSLFERVKNLEAQIWGIKEDIKKIKEGK